MYRNARPGRDILFLSGRLPSVNKRTNARRRTQEHERTERIGQGRNQDQVLVGMPERRRRGSNDEWLGWREARKQNSGARARFLGGSRETIDEFAERRGGGSRVPRERPRKEFVVERAVLEQFFQLGRWCGRVRTYLLFRGWWLLLREEEGFRKLPVSISFWKPLPPRPHTHSSLAWRRGQGWRPDRTDLKCGSRGSAGTGSVSAVSRGADRDTRTGRVGTVRGRTCAVSCTRQIRQTIALTTHAPPGGGGTHLACVIGRRVALVVDPDVLEPVDWPADRRAVDVFVPRSLHPVPDDRDSVRVVARESWEAGFRVRSLLHRKGGGGAFLLTL